MVTTSPNVIAHMLRLNQGLRIYKILVDVCGAPEDQRKRFCDYYAVPRNSYEWRFQGDLGFGGKFYSNAGRWYVGCYPEDRTPERESAIRKANEMLAVLRERESASEQR